MKILFMIIFICPIAFEPLKMGGLCVKMVVIPYHFTDTWSARIEIQCMTASGSA